MTYIKQIWKRKLLMQTKKVTDHDHDKYITISKFNQLTAEANLVQPKQIQISTSKFSNKDKF